MIALVRYQLALLGHSQRFLVPVLAYLGLLAILNSEDAGQVLPLFVITAGVLLLIAGWLTLTLVDAEDQVQRLVTVSHCGSMRRLLFGVVTTALLCSAGLAVLAIAWPTIRHGGYPPAEVGLGLLAHLACAATGVAVALPCSTLLVPRAGYSVVLAAAALAASLFLRIPLVNLLLRAMNDGHVSGGLAATSGGLALVLLIASPLVTERVYARLKP